VWNRLPTAVREQIVALALEEPELSPRELAVRFTDERRYFVSEATVYRLLKAQDLITSPAYIVVKAADEFRDKTTAPNQLWQTDFTYLKVVGWGWYYLSTVLDDFSRYIVAWKLCTTMQASDVTATLDLALTAAGLDQVQVVHRPRLLTDNGSSYVATDLAAWLGSRGMTHIRGAPRHPQTQGKIERWHLTSRTASCSNTPTCPANWRRVWPPSSSTTTISGLTRAWATSPLPTSTSAAARTSCASAHGSSVRPSPIAACAITHRPPNLSTQMDQSLRS
jgi:transposase InsO family protein